MKTYVQFLTKNENKELKPLDNIHLLDERKSLNAHIVTAFDVIDKHEAKNDIVGFNIVEFDSFRNKETIVNQNIFDY